MSLIKKLISLTKKNKSIAQQIKAKNENNQLISQKKFDLGLRRSSLALYDAINHLSNDYKEINQDLIDSIEETFLMYDLGPKATMKITEAIVDEIKFQKVNDPEIIKQIIIDKLFVYYIQDTNTNLDLNIQNDQMNVILVTGVNGVGKTTSIAKLANKFKNENYKVLLIAGDTFRAGAVEQLKHWANKIDVGFFQSEKINQDPASVIYQGLEKAKKENYQIVICDTSGRLQNKTNLMNELKKINLVIKKFEANQPCESLLVLDATTGQSGINQAKAFNEVTNLTGIILTKMDSTSKGGIVLAIKDAFNLPVKLIGLGESIDDLVSFDLESFIIGITSQLNIQ